jgi:hypothetical protein
MGGYERGCGGISIGADKAKIVDEAVDAPKRYSS